MHPDYFAHLEESRNLHKAAVVQLWMENTHIPSIPPHQKEFCPSGELAIIWHTYVQQVLSSSLFLEIYDYPMRLLRLCLEVYQRYVGGDVGDVRG